MGQKNELWDVLIGDKTKRIKWGIIAGIIIAILVVIFVRGYSSAQKKYEKIIQKLETQIDELSDPILSYTAVSKEAMLDIVKKEISGIGELATVEYMYTDAGRFEDFKQLFGMNIPFTKKSFIAKWDGIIKAGVDIEKIEVEIDEKNKVIHVAVPRAGILSHEIKTESIETLDEQNGLFNEIQVEDVRNFDAITKEAMEERAIENGILEKAQTNAGNILAKLINNNVVEEEGYTVQIRVMEELVEENVETQEAGV